MGSVLAIGAHIGDADLMCGPFLAQAARDGHETHILALTAGELGNPTMASSDYRTQKLQEGAQFADAIGASFRALDIRDSRLESTSDVVDRVLDVFEQTKPTLVLSHWSGSWHPDHRAAAQVAVDAVFRWGLRASTRLAHAENWEDTDGFEAHAYASISDAAFDTWHAAIGRQAFVHGGFSGFRYRDYYSALLTTRGCLASTNRAVAFMLADRPPVELHV